MHDVASRTLDYFLRLQRTLEIETREFRGKRHNQDLCPQLQHQLEAILNATGRFEPVVYDTQGFLDQGADIVIRVRHQRRSDAEPPELIGFQVKSYGDFRTKDLFRILKAQRDDALRKISGLSVYYLVLCTDEQQDKETIRNIEAEFKTAAKTIIIEPTYSLGFLKLSARRIQGVVTRLQHVDDLVFRRALDTVALGSPTAGILAVYLAARACVGDEHVSPTQLRDVAALEDLYTATLESRRLASDEYGEAFEEEDATLVRERIRLKQAPSTSSLARASEVFFDNFSEAIAYDVDQLDTHMLDVDSSSGRLRVRRSELLPIIALLTDAQVRYDLDDDELFPYGVEALGVAEAGDA